MHTNFKSNSIENPKKDLLEGSDFDDEPKPSTSKEENEELLSGSDFDSGEESDEPTTSVPTTIEKITAQEADYDGGSLVTVTGLVLEMEEEQERASTTVQNLMLGGESKKIKLSVWGDKIEEMEQNGLALFAKIKLTHLLLGTTSKKYRAFNRGSSKHELTATDETTIEVIESVKFSELAFTKLEDISKLRGQVINVRGLAESIDKKTSKKGDLQWTEVNLKQKGCTVVAKFWGENAGKIKFEKGAKVAFVGAKIHEYKGRKELIMNRFSTIVS